MKYFLLFVGLAMIALLLSAWKKKYRLWILSGFLVMLIALSAYVSLGNLEETLPLYRATNQHFYQPEFLEEGIYPDAILPLMVEGKTIYTKSDFRHVEYGVDEYGNNAWEVRLGDVYHGVNACNLMRMMGAEVISEDSYNDVTLTPEQKALFTDLGSANDMYRHSFAINDFDEEWGNYFHYYWYYTANGKQMHVYLNMEDYPSTSDEMVLIWDDEGKDNMENMYLMSKEYYDKEVAR